MKIIEGKLRLKGTEKIAIINSRFNHIITDRLAEGAKDAFARHGGNLDNLDLILVPGAFEIPFALEKALSTGKYDAVCCVGAIIRGSTPHFDYVCMGVTQGITHLNVTGDIPVIYGLITTNTLEQAEDRSGGKLGNKGDECAITAIKMIDFVWSLNK